MSIDDELHADSDIPDGYELIEECPLCEADDKYQEAHYFLGRMMEEYHNPEAFRWNLNAFLQALRSVTFFLQKQMSEYDGFNEWYASQQEAMRGDELLRKFVEGRNIVVKQRNLSMKSRAQIGVYGYRRLKMGIGMEIPAHLPSWYILTELAPKLGLVSPEHPFIGEEYGVERDWIAEELGDDNVVTLCDLAWVKIGNVLLEAHKFLGLLSAMPKPHEHDPNVCKLMTESDLDPNLPAKWGWGEEPG